MTALSVREVSVVFGGVRALDRVSLDVAAGARLGIIGPNGAGKTTLFDAVCGYVGLDTGQVFVGDGDVTGAPPHARARAGLARSFQDARLFPSLTVAETVALAGGRTRDFHPVLDTLGLTSQRDTPVGALPTGVRRLVELAVILVREPRVVLLDEPSAGLAPAESERLPPLLTRIATETGAAVVVVEHDVPFVSSFAAELVAMDAGRVIARGVPAAVLADPRVVTAYLG